MAVAQLDITIIIPFLNEEENIERLCSTLNDYLASLKPLTFEVIFIDDGSTDNSVNLLKQQAHSEYTAKIIKLSKNFGSLPALRAGIKKASGKYVTFQFADLQDPIELLPRLYKKVQERSDIVWACRNHANKQNPFFSRMYARMMRKYAVPNFPDNGFDIAMFNEKVKEELNENIEKNSSIFLQMLSLGYQQDYIFYDKRDRVAGKSKWTFSRKMKLVVDSFVAFSYAPVRLVTIMGISFAALGFLWMLYIIIHELFIEDLPLGLPALLSVLLMGFGVTNISLGIIAEYLWRTLDASRKRKAFIIDQVFELN